MCTSFISSVLAKWFYVWLLFYIIFLPILRSFTLKVKKAFFFLAAEDVWYMGRNIRLGLWIHHARVWIHSFCIATCCYLDLSQKHFSYICKMWISWLVFLNGTFESRWLRNSSWMFDKIELSDSEMVYTKIW